jgi:hypothetical protein
MTDISLIAVVPVEELDADFLAAVRAASFAQAQPRIITPRQFMDRLPMERQAAITASAMASPQILLWLIRLTGATEVDLDNAETLEGVQALAFAEIITEAEALALLA